jgi:hypothetical protein
MNKKGIILIVWIIVSLLIIGGVLALIWFNAGNLSNENKKNDINRVNGASSSENPFVISMAGFLGEDYEKSLDYMKEAGATGVRFMSRWGGMHWEQAEPQKGTFDWSSFDAQYLAAKERELNIMVTLYPSSPSWDNPNAEYDNEYPINMEEYLNFVKSAAERYDGDGVDDAPGSPVVSSWVLMEEIERGDEQKWWGGTPEQYADLFVKTYYAIKGANPDAIVLTYGANNWRGIDTGAIETITKPALLEINRLTSDKNDFSLDYSLHYYHTENSADYIRTLDYTKNMLAAIGLENNKIIMEDMAPFLKKDDPEKEQKVAKQIVVSHVLSFANGLKTVGWAQLSDGFEYAVNFEAGIISSPTMSNAGISNNFRNLGFYSYKLMTEKLGGSDLNNVQTIQESRDLYLFKFIKNGKNIWVAWGDNGKNVKISEINSKQVSITDAVSSKANPTNFNSETKLVNNGAITFDLSDAPVYVEEI